MLHIGADLLLLAGAEVREVGHPKSPQVKRVLWWESDNTYYK